MRVGIYLIYHEWRSVMVLDVLDVSCPTLVFYLQLASDKCQQEKRKTINGDDLLWAMAALGFDKYTEPLKLYLQKYKEVNE